MENPVSHHLEKQYLMSLEWINENINALTDDEYRMELSPGRNHGVWLLGHLIVSDDDLSTFLGKGPLLYPQYAEMFGQKSKLSVPENYPAVSVLKECWEKVCEKNKKIYSGLTDNELNEPHALIENIQTDYFKTKDRVIIAWHFHQLYHTGQLAVLVSRAGKNKY
ncbi:MAG: DinB family protein [bacterium]|nr:DinB family protein [bacterium]